MEEEAVDPTKVIFVILEPFVFMFGLLETIVLLAIIALLVMFGLLDTLGLLYRLDRRLTGHRGGVACWSGSPSVSPVRQETFEGPGDSLRGQTDVTPPSVFWLAYSLTSFSAAIS